ncbi:MAG: peptide ABC transporter ATP-binding protein, partial [Rhodospirillaceae bacterium]|nr:peptide ABC transporter ATP-binding protein [Rhodospirillaceae bacterium]
MNAAQTDRGVMLTVEDLAIEFNVARSLAQLLQGEARQRLRAVDGVSLEVRRLETLGLVGESG